MTRWALVLALVLVPPGCGATVSVKPAVETACAVARVACSVLSSACGASSAAASSGGETEAP